MALSATFVANFTSLFTEIGKAEVKFRELAVNSDKVNESVQKIGERFSGQRVIEDAAKMAQAIESIGGASMLTEREARRVNATLNEALEKAAKTGAPVTDEMRRVAAATQEAANKGGIYNNIINGLTTAAKTAATAFLAMFAFNKVIEFGQKLMSVGGQMTDLSLKTGLSTDALQKFQYAGDQMGVSLDTITSASAKLSGAVASDKASAKEAINALGIGFDNFKKMSPDQQMEVLSQKVGALGDRTEQNTRLQQIFGKSFSEVYPIMTSQFGELTEKANSLGVVIDKDTLGAMDDLGDTVSDLASVAFAGFAKIITPLIPTLSMLAKVSLEMADVAVAVLTPVFKTFGEVVKFLINTILSFATVTISAVKSIAEYVPGLDKMTGASEKADAALNKLKAIQTSLNTEHKTGEQVTKAVTVAHNEASDASEKHARAVGSLVEELTGAGAVKQVKLLEEAFKALTPEQRANDETTQKVLERYVKLRDEVGTQAAPALEKLFVTTDTLTNQFQLLDPATGKVKDQFLQLAPAIAAVRDDSDLLSAKMFEGASSVRELERAGGVLAPSLKSMNVTLETSAAKTIDWDKHLDQLVKSFQSMATIGGESFQKLAQWFGTVLAASQAARDSSTQLKEAFSGLKDGTSNTGQAVINLAAGAMSLVSAMDQATGSGNTLQRTMGGVNAGFQAGNAIVPGLGGAIGALAGGLVGLFRGLTSVSEETKKVRGEIASFEESLQKNLTTTQAAEAAGRGWAATTIAVRDAYLATGRSASEAEAIVKQLWDDKNPNAARAAIEQINKVMAEAKKVAEELDKELNGALSEAVELGMQLPEELAGAIEQLIAMGKITGDNAALFGQLTAQTEPNFKAMEDAAKKFGVELSALGPAFAQNQLNQQAQGIIDAFETMKRGGADVGGVIAGMSDEINAFVQDAVRAGGKVPENMRPILEAMIEQGQLTDENGNKLEDLSGIEFGPPIESAFDRIIAKLQELIDRIADPSGYNAMQRNAEQASSAVASYFDDEIVPAIQRGEDALNGFLFGHSPGGLKEIPILARAAGKAIQDFEGVTTESMAGAEGSLNSLLSGIRTMGSAGLSRVSVDKNASEATQKLQKEFEGFIDPTLSLLTESEALRRIIRVAEFYGQQINESVARQVLTAYGYKGGGRVIKGRLDDYLKRVSERWMEESTVGFASGTMGRTGSWFKNFGSGTPTVLHGEEAVVRRDQASAFAAAFGGGGDGAVSELVALRADVVALPHHIARAVRDAMLVAG